MPLGFWTDLPDRGVAAAEVAAVLPAAAAADMGNDVRVYAPVESRDEDVSDVGGADVEARPTGGPAVSAGRPDEPLVDLLVAGRAFHRLAAPVGAGVDEWERTSHARPEDLPADSPGGNVPDYRRAQETLGPAGTIALVAWVDPDGTRAFRGPDGEGIEATDRAVLDAVDRMTDDGAPPISDAVEQAKRNALRTIDGVNDEIADALAAGGFESPADVADATQSALSDVEAVGNALAARIKANIGQGVGGLRQGEPNEALLDALGGLLGVDPPVYSVEDTPIHVEIDGVIAGKGKGRDASALVSTAADAHYTAHVTDTTVGAIEPGHRVSVGIEAVALDPRDAADLVRAAGFEDRAEALVSDAELHADAAMADYEGNTDTYTVENTYTVEEHVQYGPYVEFAAPNDERTSDDADTLRYEISEVSIGVDASDLKTEALDRATRAAAERAAEDATDVE